ncbi:phytanoyl-CoA dioxygenase family protein [Leptolyngbya sp. BC1307]|uniref:phytanoyl-CoA dioxygenase family protein n=1 Tax=Leptolyngbya sp. BC1307 TaxID=2029589 RepID=UPI000EFA599E|nr:phytanoyl-CoA dioxygenase family protein [Leptolyngbya sp. BC1307]
MTVNQFDLFQQQGYCVVDHLLNAEQIAEIIERCDRLFNTQFETGIYPDEWYGRPGLSQPNATRQMTGLWRCDRTLASFSLSAKIAHLNASIMGWDSARYGLDTFWGKPPDAPEVSFHRQNTYVSAIDPPTTVTCWIALSGTGSLEIVPGSHRWQCHDQVRFLHAPKADYRLPLQQAADEAGVTDPEILTLNLSPGSAVLLHGDLWRGSGRNLTDQSDQAIAISTLPGEAQFQPPGTGTGYTFDRYRRVKSLELHESFYPVLWRTDGYRTPFLADYCQDPFTR